MALLCSAFDCMNCKCVDTGSIVISKKSLSTSFVYTCSVLTFKFNDKNYMAHVDDHDTTMESRLKSSLLHINKYLGNVKEFLIYRGDKCIGNCKSYLIIRRVLKELNIKNIIVYQLGGDTKVTI